MFFSSIPVRESNSSGDMAKYPAKTITSHFCIADFCSFIANPVHIRVWLLQSKVTPRLYMILTPFSSSVAIFNKTLITGNRIFAQKSWQHCNSSKTYQIGLIKLWDAFTIKKLIIVKWLATDEVNTFPSLDNKYFWLNLFKCKQKR